MCRRDLRKYSRGRGLFLCKRVYGKDRSSADITQSPVFGQCFFACQNEKFF